MRQGRGRAFTVTGASTRWTLLSSTRISRALAQRALTSASLMYSQFLSCSICDVQLKRELMITPPPTWRAPRTADKDMDTEATPVHAQRYIPCSV